MSNKTHTVISGDTLGAIAIRYLGSFQKWNKIVEVNPMLSGRKKASDGSPLVFPGDNLIIPSEEKTESPTVLPNPQPEPPTYIANAKTKKPVKTIQLGGNEQDVSILVDGKQFIGFTGYEINLNYDSFDTFSFSAPYDVAMKDIKDTIMPFAFKDCAVYYNGNLLFNGTLLTPDPELSNGAKEISLQGYPLCGILNDCTIPLAKYPASYDGLTLKEIAEPLCESYGIGVEFQSDPGSQFKEISFEPTEKVLNLLSKLAQQQQLLFTNDTGGRLVFFKPQKEPSFVSFKEGEMPLMSLKSKFNAQGFYSHINGFTKVDKEKEPLAYTWENRYLTEKGITRFMTIIINDAETQDDLEKGVVAFAGRMFADCVSYDLECEGHLTSNGSLFKKGMTVSVNAPGAMIMSDTDFIARNIKLKRDTTGKTASISLVLPGSFTEEIPEVLPWE
jgi:prophage tail gpP-like protein